MKCPQYKNMSINHETKIAEIICNGTHEMSLEHSTSIRDKFCNGNFLNCNYYKKGDCGMEKTSTALTEIKAKALDCHNKIIASAYTATTAILEMAKSLKKMRDEELYIELGFTSFGNYVEDNGDYKFKERQAYTYIKVYEDLGTQFLQSNANLGVTKLELLTKIPSFDRQEFIEENNIAGMTVKEIEDIIKKNQQQGEQLSLLTAEIEETKKAAESERLENENANASALEWKEKALKKEKEKAEVEEQLKKMRDEIKSIKQKPIEIAVKEPSAEDVEKIKAEAIAKAKKDFETEKNKLKGAYEELIKQEKEKAIIEKQKLEEKVKGGNIEESKLAFKIYFQEMQDNINNLIKCIENVQDENLKTRYKEGLKKHLIQVEELL